MQPHWVFLLSLWGNLWAIKVADGKKGSTVGTPEILKYLKEFESRSVFLEGGVKTKHFSHLLYSYVWIKNEVLSGFPKKDVSADLLVL